MINPMHAHAFHASSKGTEHATFIASLLDEVGNPYLGTVQSLFGDTENDESYHLVQLDESGAAEYMKRLRLAITLQKSNNTFARSIALFDIFSISMQMLFREMFSISKLQGRLDDIVEQVKNIIHSDIPPQQLTRTNIAKQLEMHPNYLNTIFSSVEGITLGEYIICARFERACQMLQVGKRIKNISEECGFTTHNYFSRSFKKRFGCTPAEYRNHWRNIISQIDTTI